MAVTTVFNSPVAAGTTMTYQAQLLSLDPATLNVPIPGSALVSLTLTVWAVLTGNPIVNAINNVNILNTGRGTIDESGVLQVVLSPTDNVLVGTVSPETHIALVQWSYGLGGMLRDLHQVQFSLESITNI